MSRTAKLMLTEAEAPFLGMEACAKKHEVQDTKVERRLLDKNLRLVQRV